jgi:DNA polymerase III sliding clamp (beta) subunit (PCNA family)
VTKVVFETAAIADAVRKAAKVAPSKGAAFDKASGIVLEINIDEGEYSCVVRSTDLIVFYSEWVTIAEAEGERTKWRVPADLLAGVIGSIPTKNKTVTFEEKDAERGRIVHLSSGKIKAKFILNETSYYPEWDIFDPEGLFPVENFIKKISLVDWACDKTPPLSGVYLDGQCAVGTDKYKVVRVELPIDPENFSDPIVLPTRTLVSVLGDRNPEISLAVDETELLVMPDEFTQIRTILFAEDFPSLERAMRRDHPDSVRVKKTSIIEMINRSLHFVGGERNPTLKVYLGKSELAVFMNNQEVGLLGDVLDVDGAEHSRVTFNFNPGNLLQSIERSPSEEVTLHYDHENPLFPLRVEGPSYEAWIAPRRDMDGD